MSVRGHPSEQNHLELNKVIFLKSQLYSHFLKCKSYCVKIMSEKILNLYFKNTAKMSKTSPKFQTEI